ncbi:MAG TPA: polysaccharide biosynthesis tyrosine autokinase [Burkholderiales bacterium]|nr:polysaccharide biosynthesis tyrosine autokinase [Burkholderiales bacterium]
MAAEALTDNREDFAPNEGAGGEPLELALYWRAIFRRKWWLLGTALVCAVLTAVAVMFLTPIYRATVTLMIEQNKAKLVSIEEVYSGISPNREHYQTQAEMLRSPALAARVIEKLGLMTHPEFDPRQQKLSAWTSWLPGGDEPVTKDGWSEERVKAVVLNDFLRRMTIEPIRLTQLVKVGFDAADPELAARIANTIADVYIDADIEIRARLRQRATDWLAERLSDLKGNLEGSERALQQYREREGLPDTKGLAQSGVVRQLEVLSSAVNDATERRVEAEANYRQAKEAKDRTSLPIVLRNTAVERLKELEGGAEKRVAELSERYGPEHPRLIQAKNELAQARENTKKGVDSAIASFAKEYQVALANERSAERALGAAKGSVQQINRKEFQLDALEQDLTANRQIYEKFMNRYRETRAASDTQSSLVARVIDPAVRPGVPYKPRKREIVMAGFASGLLLAAIVALLLERMNSTIKTAEEVEQKLGLPTLAVVPLLTGDAAGNAGRYYLENPSSVFSEAIRTARTSILLSAIDSANKVLLVTSSVPSEGKTSFALNLALAHAQAKKTLLIEADLRRPSVVKQLALDPSKPGLTSLFAGDANFTECVQRVEGSSLYVLPSGPPPDNPQELLSSHRFAQLIERVAAACEVVIIDSPPVHLVSDAVVLSTLATGVLFVVKADDTPYPVARRCIRSLYDAGAPIIGVALNQLDFTQADRYYGAYTGYAKEYGAYQGTPG